MKKILLLLFVSVLTLTFTSVKAQGPYLTPFTDMTYQQLVEEVLLNNTPCAEISNVVGITGVDFGNVNAQGIGRFENSNPLFPMESGVVLATGGIMTSGTTQGISGPTSGVNLPGGGWPGDPQLTAYLNANQNVPVSTYNDASILEFDFTSFTDSISFNFVFSSNEYGGFQCSYSDSFAFFLEAPDGTVTNLAIIRDSAGNIVPGVGGDEIPISVTTIRDNAYNTSCSSENATLFDTYWGPANANAPINQYGQTVMMQAWTYVTPYTSYRMKMVVQDRGDTSFDSAVFLEAGSFFIGNIDLGGDIDLTDEDAVCVGEPVVLEVDLLPDCDYQWFFEGTLLPGEESNIIIVTQPGIYSLEVSCGDQLTCVLSDEIYVAFKVTPELPSMWENDIIVCGSFNNLQLVATPTNLDELTIIDYAWYFNGVRDDSNTSSIYNVTQPGQYTVVVDELGCAAIGTITVTQTDFTVDLGPDQFICSSSAGVQLEATLSAGANAADTDFLWSTGETTQTITATTSGTYTVDATFEGCTETDSVDVFLRDYDVDLGPDVVICDLTVGYEIIADIGMANPNEVTYLWSNGATTPTITVFTYGVYNVDVTWDDCVESDQMEIIQADPPVITLGQNIQKCANDPVTISVTFIDNVEGNVTYTWFYNGGVISGETASSLTLTELGIYRVITNNEGCISEAEILVEGYASNANCVISQGISPDGSPGKNDNLDLQFLADRTGIENLQIFNRNGVLVYELNNYVNEWIGQSKNGDSLPTGLYFYVINLAGDDPVYGTQTNGNIYINRGMN